MKIILRTKKNLKVFMITFLFTHPSFAEKISLNTISNYINELTMLKADFEQINSNGSIETGKIYIRRPGKMRLEYAAPSNALVIAGAGSIAIFDNKTKSGPVQFPLNQTPLKILLTDDINLVNNNIVYDHSIDGKNTHIVIQDPERVSQGRIEMVFSNSPINLLGWIITNQAKQKTTIKLSKLNKDIKIPLYLFNIDIAVKNKN